ncbi:aspartyl-phosphate phosphatase Spo0E family protein [Paenibacillus sp. CC-CFT747]|nr:aspartyl-phosphate phosphatase Spo0E family protein [Paenibacillus sp. CC-CFT747]
MRNNRRLDAEIESVKKHLALIAHKYQYNFRHPQVVAVSERLDRLILRQMKP